MELARINEIYQHVHPTLSREIAQLISHVNCKVRKRHFWDAILY
jgi:hypothetical protein